MIRKLLLAVTTLAAMLALASPPALASTPTQLVLPGGPAFAVLGYSCGGINQHDYATGFDASTGYPTGAVYLSTTCSSGGRGSRPVTHTAWAGATWDYTGALVSYQKLSSAPSVSTTFSAYDKYGNEVYNTSTAAYLLLANGFVPPPRITGISVTQGPATGGTSVTISGTGFTGVTSVSFGSTAAVYTVASSTSITATSPAEGAGTVDITVTNAGGTSSTGSGDQFTFVAAPTVTGASPSSGTTNGGTYVTITGTSFTGATSVTFGGTAAGFWVNSDTSITAISPSSEGETGRVNVVVSNIGGKSPTSSADQFTYVAPPPPPAVTGISPSSGTTAGGDTVTISGTGFTGATDVQFGGVSAASFTVNSDTSITAISPAGYAGTVDVTVFTPNGTSAYTAADQFTYIEPPPTVTGVSPNTGTSAGGDTVTISGTGFTDATEVDFGTTPVYTFTINSDSSITITTPAGTPGPVDVTVVAGGGTSAISAADQFTYF